MSISPSAVSQTARRVPSTSTGISGARMRDGFKGAADVMIAATIGPAGPLAASTACPPAAEIAVPLVRQTRYMEERAIPHSPEKT
ncbi:hypothetical protein GCM10011611_60590 [Aliidongia dinghuensis]|uniref:Uncharacterized protein n=1 Tax=Aliidongia dinghuensis TaxID=1867774 RepID=A0A8J3E6X7_9PROT|nr:hypothetical protein GCM10011611_60590 [Aliidongia dinghuensis]